MAFGGIKGTLTGGNNSIPNPLQSTGSVSVAVGDVVVALIAEQTSLTATTVTDNLGNTYSAQNAGTLSGTTISGRCYYSRVTVAGTLTTISHACTSSTHDAASCAIVIEGPFVASPVDANPANITNDTTTPYNANATGTLAQADEVIVGWMVQNSSSTYTASPGTKQVTKSQSANAGGQISTLTVSATTTQTMGWTGTAPTANVIGAFSLKKDLTQALTPSLFTNSSTYPSATVSATYALTPSLFSNSPTFNAHTLVATYPLTPALKASETTFPSGTVGRGAVGLTASLKASETTFPSATVTPGAVGLTPSLFTNSPSFPSPTVLPVAALVQSAVFTNASIFNAHTMTYAYELLPALFSDGDTIYSHTVAPGNYPITEGLFTNSNSFPSPTAAPGAVNLSPSLVSGTTFPSATVARLDNQDLAESATFANGNSFFAASIDFSDPAPPPDPLPPHEYFSAPHKPRRRSAGIRLARSGGGGGGI